MNNTMLRWVAALSAALVLASCGGGDAGSGEEAAGNEKLIAEGKELYEGTCAACHGMDLRGTGTGPPFLDPVYAPNHHPDAAFYTAVELGVQPHHWKFGPMPAQQHISDDEVTAIIAYVRSVQTAEGVTKDPSH